MSIRSSASATARSSSPASRRQLTSAGGGLGRHAGRERLPSRAGEDDERSRHRIGSGGAGGAQRPEQVVEPEIALDGRSGARR